MIAIKRGLTTIATVSPDSGKQSQKIMGENVVSMSFSLFQHIEFEVGDYIEVFGQAYYLNKNPNVKKTAKSLYSYLCLFEGLTYEPAKVQFMTFDADNNLQNADFSLMGNAETFIDLVIKNLNRAQSGWSKGDVDVTDFKNLTFSANADCLGVLTMISDAFSTEFWIIGKTIHFTAKGATSGLSFEYGKDKGLYNIARSNKEGADIITRLYAFGANKNIPSDYRNYAKRLRIPLSANDGKIYIEQNVSNYGLIEHTEIFEDVYPQREGVVSAVATTGTNPFLKFSDNGIDFDVNSYLLPGVTAKLTFNTGQLAGYTFDVSSFNNGTKQFIINPNEEENAFQIPSALLKPAIGNKYVLTDIKMPPSYVDAAENLLLSKATEYLSKNAVSQVKYAVECDRLKFERDNIQPVLGSFVNIKDADLAIDADIRVIGLTRDLINPYQYDLELSESAEPSSIVRQYIANQKVINAIKINNLLDPAKARRNWRDSQELLNLVFDTDGYFTDKIKPLSIETASLAVGARSQQFDLNGLVVEANFQGNANEFRSSLAILDHFTIDPTQIVSWNISASSYSGLFTGNAYYIYAKCEKSGSNGTILLTGSQITVNEDSTYYHFLIGILHSTSSIASPRGLSLNYGQSTVNGKFIKTGKIISSDGTGYIDLDNNNFSFGNLTSGIDWNVSTPNQLTVRGHIEATSGTIAGVSIEAGNNFSLDGDKVKITPNAGIEVFNGGYLKIPSVNSANPSWKISIDENATGGTALPLPQPYFTDLQGLDAASRADGYVIYWDAATLTHKYKVAGGGSASTVPWSGVTGKPTTLSGYGITDVFNKTEADGRFKAIGYTPSNSEVLSALGFTPYNSSNPSGYITASALSPYALSNGSNATGNWGVNISGNAATATTATNWTGSSDLGSNAYTSTAYATALNPSFTGGIYHYGSQFNFYGTSSEIVNRTAPYLDIYGSGVNLNLRLYSNGSSQFFSDLTAPTFIGALTGNASSASSAPWSGITGKPTALSQFTNDLGNYGNWITASSLSPYALSATVTANFQPIENQRLSTGNNVVFAQLKVSNSNGVIKLEPISGGNNAFYSYGAGEVGYQSFIFYGTSAVFYNPSIGEYIDIYAKTFIGALTGNATTATTLQNARTLWGQSFNGAGNISGALSGVTDLTASGQITSANIKATAKLEIPEAPGGVPNGNVWEIYADPNI